MKAEILIEGLAFPEGPRWHEGRLWFSDMHSRTVQTVDLEGRLEDVVEVPGLPSGLGFLPDGSLLIVSMTDRRLLRWSEGRLEPWADLSSLASHHCNDLVVDGRGRAYCGNFGFDLWSRAESRPAELILVTGRDEAEVVASDLGFPNGTVITPRGDGLVVAESMAGRLTAFDVAASGELSNRRLWAPLEGLVPDGICLDEEGAIWVASPNGRGCLRVLPGGRITDEVEVTTDAFACMLGGPDRRQLLIATAGSSDPHDARRRREGRIERIEVDVPGTGWP